MILVILALFLYGLALFRLELAELLSVTSFPLAESEFKALTQGQLYKGWLARRLVRRSGDMSLPFLSPSLSQLLDPFPDGMILLGGAGHCLQSEGLKVSIVSQTLRGVIVLTSLLVS